MSCYFYQATPPHRRNAISLYFFTPSLRRFLPSPIPPPTIPSSPFHRSPLARRFCIYHVFPSLTMFSRSYHCPPPPPRPRHGVLLAISSPFLPLPPSRPTKPAHHAGPPSRPALTGDDHLLFPVTTTRSSRRSPPASRNRRSLTAAVRHLLLHLSCLAISHRVLSRYLPNNASSPSRCYFPLLIAPLPASLPLFTHPSSHHTILPFPSLTTRPPLLHLSYLPFTYHVLPLLPPPTAPPSTPTQRSSRNLIALPTSPTEPAHQAGPPRRPTEPARSCRRRPPALPSDHHSLFPAITTGSPATAAPSPLQ